MKRQKDHAAAAARTLQADAPKVTAAINALTSKIFRTRGGRLGSGMGSLLEALWVYQMNKVLRNEGGIARECELAWLQDHEPADFACLLRDAPWEPATRDGELFRIEAKSMNLRVEEAKGHFSNLQKETKANDQLLVLIWEWTPLNDKYAWPKIKDFFLGASLPTIALRDALHVARGGRFVSRRQCPDGCAPARCPHDGEPLNAAKKRERRSGPTSCKPAGVEFAANFGGLLRMLKTTGESARSQFREIRRSNDVAHQFISFIHTYFPKEELAHVRKSEWSQLVETLLPGHKTDSPQHAQELLRRAAPSYREHLRTL